MSSQGANTTTLANGYAFDPISIRDSSDVTRRIRENLTTIASTSVRPTKDPWIRRGNGYRLAALNGNFKCFACAGNAFGLNGVP
jgi:hypothetical protein